MTKRDPDQDSNFLSRWSQRKRAARTPLPETHGQEAARQEGEATGDAGPAGEVAEISPDQLPDVDSLDESSDFSAFMRPGVPRALKQRALRKLWQVDPAFKHICMLDDYNLDYTDAAMVVPDLKTIYQVGKGMILPEEEEAAAEVAAQAEVTPGDALADSGGGSLPAPPAAEAEERVRVPGGAASADAAETGGEQPVDRRAAAPRTPGAPVVDSTPASRRRSPRAQDRSALRRRWGDGEA